MKKLSTTQKADEDMSKEQASRDAYDRASLNLHRLKGLVVSVNLINENGTGGYKDEQIGYALGLVEEWLEGIREDMDEISLAREDLVTRCELARSLLVAGAYTPQGTLRETSKIIDEIDGFLNDDLPRILKIKNELKVVVEEAHRRALREEEGTISKKAA